MNKIILVNKEKDYTSRDVVNIISKIFGTKKVGHTGTLDPLATGVLAICIGKYTKLADYITAYDKEYIAEIILGIKTDTGDITGNILDTKESNYTEEEIDNILKIFKKSYMQTVPIYSAVKVNGKKLYEYARENIEVELPSKMVNIMSIERTSDVVNKDNQTIFSIKVKVSKGTYIRSLIEDIASELNTVGTMKNLIRTRQGDFDIKDTYTLSEIKENKFEFLDETKILTEYTKIKVFGTYRQKILNGQKLINKYEDDKIVFIDEENHILALYKVSEKDKTMIIPLKML